MCWSLARSEKGAPFALNPVSPPPLPRPTLRSAPSWRFGPAELVLHYTQPSPVKSALLCNWLTHINYNAWAIRFLASGFTHGFRLGISAVPDSPRPRPGMPSRKRLRHINHKSATLHPEAIREYIQAELAAQRIVCIPGDRLPSVDSAHWGSLTIAPLGLVQKGHTNPPKYRMTFDASFGGVFSPNAAVPDAFSATSYADFATTLTTIHRAGPGAHMALFDIRAAFRLLPIHPRDIPSLGMHFEGSFYLECFLPFGVSCGPSLFNMFGAAVEAVLESRGVVLRRMLDDHFIVAPSEAECSLMLSTALAVMAQLGIPVAENKTVQPTQRAKFLGYLWRTDAHVASGGGLVSLDPARWSALGQRLLAVLSQPDALCAQELRSILGLLAWASCVIPLGRAHTSALYRVLCGVGGNSMSARQARATRVTLSAAAISELHWWHRLTVVADDQAVPPGRSFDSLLNLQPATVTCSTDASSLALGAWWRPADEPHAPAQWLQAHVPACFTVGSKWRWCEPGSMDEQPTPLTVSSCWLEAAAVLAAVHCWGGGPWANTVVRLQCDNLGVVHAWRNQFSASPVLCSFVQMIALQCSLHNVCLSLEWVEGATNCLADAISRLQVDSSSPPATLTSSPSFLGPAPWYVLSGGLSLTC